jgi:hypothetical protein
MDAGSTGLSSGFVLAALIAAVLLLERIGGLDQVSRRLFQVALAVAIAFATIAATTAFVRTPEYPAEEQSSSTFDSQSEEQEQLEFFEKVNNRGATRMMIHFAVGVVALVAGVYATRRWPTVALGALLGGVLLIIFGGARGGGSDDFNPLTAYFAAASGAINATVGQRSQSVDIVSFVVFLGGALGLLALGLLEWDEPRPATAVEPPAEAAP